jgi:hypothetical protein
MDAAASAQSIPAVGCGFIRGKISHELTEASETFEVTAPDLMMIPSRCEESFPDVGGERGLSVRDQIAVVLAHEPTCRRNER